MKLCSRPSQADMFESDAWNTQSPETFIKVLRKQLGVAKLIWPEQLSEFSIYERKTQADDVPY